MTDLDAHLAAILTLDEARTWIAAHLEEFGITRPPSAETLKRAAYEERLVSRMKGGIRFTDTAHVREYMRHFDPKNKTESRPLQPRAAKRRGTQ